MSWIPKQSQNFSFASTRCMMRAIRSACACLFFLALLLPFFSLAESNELARALSVEDLSEEQFNLLAMVVSGDRASSASAGNITNDVAAILELLQKVSNRNSSTWRIKTELDLIAGLNSTRFLNLLFSERATDGLPTQAQSYLYEIQRSLYGSSGVPSSHDSVIPTLLRMEGKIGVSPWSTNDVLRALQSLYNSNDHSVADLLSDAIYALDDISNQRLMDWNHGSDVGSVVGYIWDASTDIADTLKDNFSSVFVSNRYDSGLAIYNDDFISVHDSGLAAYLAEVYSSRPDNNDHPVFYVEDSYAGIRLSYIDSALSDIASNLPDWGSIVGTGEAQAQGMTNLVSDLASVRSDIERLRRAAFDIAFTATNISDYSRAIHENDLNYSVGSVSSDFDYVKDRLFDLNARMGFDNPSPTNSLSAVLARFFDSSAASAVVASNSSAVSAVASSESSFTNAIASSESESSNVATNAPDFDEHQYTGSNPISSGDRIFDLPQRQFSAITPQLPESTDSTIVLYRGNFPIFRPSSISRSGANSLSADSVNLDISYALRDNDHVSIGISNIRSIMEFVWDWVFLILSVAMLFSFYSSLTESRNQLNGGVGGLTLN